MNLWITGDSSTNNEGADKSLASWGQVVHQYFDSRKVTVINAAVSGTSIRDYVNRGYWSTLLTRAKKGDLLLTCHGHLELAPLTKPQRGCRGSLPGDSDESTVVFDPFYKKEETVHTFGWYIRKYIADCQARGIKLVLLAPPIRNQWENGVIRRGSSLAYRDITRKIARQNHVPFMDSGQCLVTVFNRLGQEKVAAYYGHEDTLHTNPAGAQFIAQIIFHNLCRRFPDLFKALAVSPGA